MKVDVERLREVKAWIEKINKEKLENIEWIENWEPLKIDPALVRAFKYTGLYNVDFIMTGFYRGKK